MTTSHRRTWTRACRGDVFGTVCLLHLAQPHKHAWDA
jgi:hypothetical protein